MAYLSIHGCDHYYEWVTAAGKTASSPAAAFSAEVSPAEASPTGPTASGKPTLVFIHGWGGSARYWQSTAIALAEKFDCLLYDLRGFARSTRQAQGFAPNQDATTASDSVDYRMSAYANDLVGLLDHLGIENVHLIAHSMGASIAVVALNQIPQRIERAILTSSGVFDYDARAFQAFQFFSRQVVKFRPAWLAQVPGCAQLFMQRFLHQPLSPQVCQEFLLDYLQAEQRAALGTIQQLFTETAAGKLNRQFVQIQVPTLLITGQYDKIIPVPLAQRAIALNSVLRQVVIANTGHFPMLEDPSAYVKAVRAFFSADPSTLSPTILNHNA